MYYEVITISPCTHKQLLSSTLARLRSSHLPLGLLLRVVEVLRSEAGPQVGAGRLLFVRQCNILVFVVVAVGSGALLWVVAVVDNFFDLVFDLFLADGAVGVGRVFRFRLLFAIEGLEQFVIGRLLFLFQR